MRTEKGFTLIELLVVISIIALLSSVVMSSLNSARAKARDATRKATIVQIFRAFTAYYSDTGTYPSTGGNDSRACLGRTSSQTCAFGSASHTGQNAIKSAIDPYMSVPLDPNPTRGGNPDIAEGYIYSSRCDYSWTDGVATVDDNRPCVIWFPEGGVSDASCKPGVMGSSGSAICGTSCSFCSVVLGE